MASDDDSVTVVTTRRVRPGREAEFEAWLEGIGQEAAKFPGLLGRRIKRPAENDRPEYVVVFKFDSYPHLRGWTESPVRQQWLKKVEPLVLDEFKETYLTGLEAWFTLPTQPNLAPPARYKMATVTGLVVYPLSMGLTSLLKPVLAGLHPAVASLCVTVLMIGLMTWVLMPRATRLFKFWLYP